MCAYRGGSLGGRCIGLCIGGSVANCSSICGGGRRILAQLAAACSSTTTSARPCVVVCCAGAAACCCVGADLRKISQSCHGDITLTVHCTAEMMRSAKAQHDRAQKVEKASPYKMAGIYSAEIAKRQCVLQLSEQEWTLSLRTIVTRYVRRALQQQTHLVDAAAALPKLIQGPDMA